MARIRTIKPQFFRNYELYQREMRANKGRSGKALLNLRIAFVGLITAADREGRFKWRPEELKLDCLPYDPVDFSEVMAVLAEAPAPFIARYVVDGQEYGVIPGFCTHQRPKHDEAQSTIPAPPDTILADQTPTGVQPEANRETTDVKEGKGKEGKGKDIAQSRFVPPTLEEVTAYCLERGKGMDPGAWMDYHAARGWRFKNGQPMKDWQASVRTWERNSFGVAKSNQDKERELSAKLMQRLETEGF